MFGKLSLAAIPLDQPIPLVTGAVVLVVILAVLAWVVIAGHLPYLWREWITSVDHKRIGVMYVLLASVMLTAQGQTPPAAKPDPTRVLVSSGIPGVIAPGTKTEFVRGGFVSTEGVIGMPDGSVLFCEQNLNKIHKLDVKTTDASQKARARRSYVASPVKDPAAAGK